jgi:hypothetical protein
MWIRRSSIRTMFRRNPSDGRGAASRINVLILDGRNRNATIGSI